MRKKFARVIIVMGLFFLVACGKEQMQEIDNGYQRITMEEAREIFEANAEEEHDYVIVDVRTVEEYNEGHIPGSICIPNELISDEEIAELPDKEQVIYIYCRSGNRSKQSSQKLVDKGYTNIIEFGGIIDWTGEVEN